MQSYTHEFLRGSLCLRGWHKHLAAVPGGGTCRGPLGRSTGAYAANMKHLALPCATFPCGSTNSKLMGGEYKAKAPDVAAMS